MRREVKLSRDENERKKLKRKLKHSQIAREIEIYNSKFTPTTVDTVVELKRSKR